MFRYDFTVVVLLMLLVVVLVLLVFVVGVVVVVFFVVFGVVVLVLAGAVVFFVTFVVVALVVVVFFVVLVVVDVLVVVGLDSLALDAYWVVRPAVAALIIAPLVSLLYCQSMTPAYQPISEYALAVHAPRSVEETSPVLTTSD